MDQLNSARDKIDTCDQLIINAFEERMEAVEKVIKYKQEHGLAIYDSKREVEVLEKVLKNVKNPENIEAVQYLYQEILMISRKMQSKMLFPFNIVLIGFMGTGKTTVGKVLAEKLEMDFIDIDSLISERLGKTISQFFHENGEVAFREIEKAVVEEVSNLSNTIISCGGGVVLHEENITNLRKNGKTILLMANEETIYNRIKTDQSRPLLKNGMGIEKIKELLQYRRELYTKSADVIVNTEGKSPEAVCNEMIKIILNN